MSAVQAWQSAVQQLKELGKLHGQYRQHNANGNNTARLAAMVTINDLGVQFRASVPRVATRRCGSDAECAEIVSKVRRPRFLRLRSGDPSCCSAPALQPTPLF
jgi:hypothetical protein